jgi:hypothetical protein
MNTIEAREIARRAKWVRRLRAVIKFFVWLGILEVKEVPRRNITPIEPDGPTGPAGPYVYGETSGLPGSYGATSASPPDDYERPIPHCCICKRHLSYFQLSFYDRILIDGISKPVCQSCIRIIKES